MGPLSQQGVAIPPILIEPIAGLTAGLLSTLVVHPLDLIKTRLQVDRSVTKHSLGASLRIARNVALSEGPGVVALYRGLGPNVAGNMASWGLYFMLYGELKTHLQHRRGWESPHGGLASLDYLLASASAGVLTAVCTNPFWVIKTRMLSTGREAPGAYSSLSDGFKTILQKEGSRGLWRGLVPALFGVTHGALQFMFYEKFKIWRRQIKANARHCEAVSREGKGATSDSRGNMDTAAQEAMRVQGLSNMDFLMLSGASKVLAGCITYPYRVVQTRMQIYDADTIYSSARDAVVKIAQREGLSGFYKGHTEKPAAPFAQRVILVTSMVLVFRLLAFGRGSGLGHALGPVSGQSGIRTG